MAAVVWPFRSMLERPFFIRREYRTEIIPRRDGSEQRRALRQTPRKRVEFTTSLANGNWLAFNRSMVRDQRRELITYDRVRAVALASEMAVGTDCDVDEVPDWLVADQSVMLIDGSRMESFTVDSIDGTTVTFTEAATTTWPAGTKLHAALTGRLDASLNTNVVARAAVNADVVFQVTPGSELAEPEGAAAQTFNDREVFLTRPNHWTPVSIMREQDRETIDFGYGLTEAFHPIAFASPVWQADFTRAEFDNAEEIRAFFDRMKGQRGEFYMPTFEADLPLVQAAGSATQTLRVEGTEVNEIFDGSTVYGAVATFVDGAWRMRQVTGIAEDAGASVITVDSNWGVDIPATATVSWMPVWRLASDILELEWGHDRYAHTRLAMRMIEDLAPEVIA